MTPTADTPVPRQLSEEERALWEKASAVRPTDRITQIDADFIEACSPAVILSLLTALSSEREAGEIGHAAIALHRAEMLDVEEHEFDQYTHCHGCEKIREAKDALALLLARRDRATSTEPAHAD